MVKGTTDSFYYCFCWTSLSVLSFMKNAKRFNAASTTKNIPIPVCPVAIRSYAKYAITRPMTRSMIFELNKLLPPYSPNRSISEKSTYNRIPIRRRCWISYLLLHICCSKIMLFDEICKNCLKIWRSDFIQVIINTCAWLIDIDNT